MSRARDLADIADYNIDSNLTFGDNDKAQFGAGSDLQIYHDGLNSYIHDNGTGDLFIRGSSNVYIQNSGGGSSGAQFVAGGAANINYAGATKLATTATGVDVTGAVTADGLTISTSDPYITLTDSDTGVDHEIDGQSGIGNLAINVDKNSEGSNSGFVVNVKGNQYMRVDDGGDISFYDNTGTTQGFFWDASTQRLGLGTTSPLGGLQIGDATVDANNKIVLGKAETSAQGYFPVIQQTSSDGVGNDLTLATTSTDGVLRFLTGNTNVNAVIGTLNNKERLRIAQNGDISFYEDTGTTAKLFWDANEERLGINTTLPSRSLHVVDDSADPLVVERSTTGNTSIQATDGTDTVYFGMPTGGGFAVDSDANLAAAPWLKIDSSGTVTKPNQTSFLVMKNADQTLTPGTTDTMTWDQEIWDIGGNFASNTFTAPVEGRYYLHFMARIDAFDTAASYYQLNIVTSNRTGSLIIDPNFSADLVYYSRSLSSVFDMDAGDTAFATIRQLNGTASHIDEGNSYTAFSGYLLG